MAFRLVVRGPLDRAVSQTEETMSAVGEAIDGALSDSLPRRPAAWLSVLIDGAFAVAAYLGAYWLRFSGGQLESFLGAAWASLPIVVTGQVLSLAALGAYARRPRLEWLLRVICGILAGTAAASIVVALSRGLHGLSRSAFVADAVLLSITALVWRGLWVLRARSRVRGDSRATVGDLVDRSAEMTTFKGVIRSLYSYRELLKNLVLKDIKLKYRGSVFGFLWSLTNPLLMIVVYTVAFTVILRIRSEGFVFCLMLGQLSWTFFSSSAAMSTGAIVDNAGLLKSVVFPRAILPVGTVLFNLAQYLLTISVFLPVMMLWYQLPPSAATLAFPIFLGLQVVLTIGLALILAAGTAFFRDVRHLLEVALAVLFWTTPIVYELRHVPERLQLLILLSPLSPFVVAYQEIFYYRAWPGGTVWLMATAHAFGAFVLGTLLFWSLEDRFTEQL